MTSTRQLLTGQDFQRMALAAAAEIDSQHDALSRLDAAGGDGDHGANVKAALTQAREVITRHSEPSPASVMGALVVAFQEHMGGAAGVLFGAFFSGVEDVFGNDPEIDGRTFAHGLASGLKRTMKLGKAEVGDRTMVDALGPAVDAASRAASAGETPHQILSEAATAARSGAEATKDLVPRLGRAAYAPEKAIGTPDAGATTAALILEAWARATEKASS